MGEERKMYKVLVGKHEGRRPFGRPRRRLEDGVPYAWYVIFVTKFNQLNVTYCMSDT
jgi:hypothetical protein